MTSQLLWTGDDVINAVRGQGKSDWVATGVAIDSRTVKPGDLFIALRGPIHDAHDFVAQALAMGAAAAIVHQRVIDVAPGAAIITVEDTFAALQDLGSFARQRSDATIIGITGSVGKTGSKEQLRAMLSAQGETYANEGSFNNHWGVPLSLARLPHNAHWGVFEIGMNHAGEAGMLAKQAQPHVGLVTNVEAVHLEFFESVEGIADAEGELFQGINAQGTAVLNRDNKYFARLLALARTQGIQKILSFGSDSDADAQLLDCRMQASGSMVKARFFGEMIDYQIGTPGQHIAFNSLGTLLAAHAAGADLQVSAGVLASFQPPSGRGNRELVRMPDGGSFTLVDESYNASPVATRAAIAVLGQSTPGSGGRRIAILGDMRELGPTAPQMHAELAEPLVEAKADLVFCCGHLMQGLHEALPRPMRGRYSTDSKGLIDAVTQLVRSGDVVMVKGSKSMHMDYVITALRGLGKLQHAG
jgi:UDP-N-acetylmuramoyl-tripeptide--D-alanyl-D-alanine ligase